jgi:hypothetical protein
MANWKQVRRIVLALPECREKPAHGRAAWCVGDKSFLWERPLRPADVEALGPRAPKGPILAVRVPSLLAKEAVIGANPAACFTTPHFDGYPAVLIRLDKIAVADLEDRIVEAWLARAPKRVAQLYLDSRRGRKRTVTS